MNVRATSAKLAAQRTPAAVQAQLAAQEAAYQAEVDWRKETALRNVEKWEGRRVRTNLNG
jgi:hypothetical protein